MYYPLLVLMTNISGVSAAPIQHPLTESLYEPEPRERGTFTLVWGCVSTLILCIWTAMRSHTVLSAI